MLYSSYVIQVYFALVFFVKYIVILLANLQKKKVRNNRIQIKKKKWSKVKKIMIQKQ